jgi:hypothetical protein
LKEIVLEQEQHPFSLAMEQVHKSVIDQWWNTVGIFARNAGAIPGFPKASMTAITATGTDALITTINAIANSGTVCKSILADTIQNTSKALKHLESIKFEDLQRKQKLADAFINVTVAAVKCRLLFDNPVLAEEILFDYESPLKNVLVGTKAKRVWQAAFISLAQHRKMSAAMHLAALEGTSREDWIPQKYRMTHGEPAPTKQGLTLP